MTLRAPTRPTSNLIHLMCQWPLCIVLLFKAEDVERSRRDDSMLSSRNASNYNAFGEMKER